MYKAICKTWLISFSVITPLGTLTDPIERIPLVCAPETETTVDSIGFDVLLFALEIAFFIELDASSILIMAPLLIP